MNNFCPNCEADRPVEVVRKRENHRLRDLDISLEVEFLECTECGADFDLPGSDDTMERVYTEYRRRKGMVQPEDIRRFRIKYGLTQHELARLLGWGAATLSRYENGALQDEAHDRALQMALDPHNLHKLIEKYPDELGDQKRGAVIQNIRSGVNAGSELLAVIESQLGGFEPCQLNGYRRFSPDKFFNAALYFCRAEGGLSRTKLNKLMWYADGKHFRDQGRSITGARYAHCPHGPAPDKFELLFTYLLEGSRELTREDRNDGYWEALVPSRDPDMNVFSPSELSALVQTQENFKNFTAKSISDYAHEEVAYRSTADGQIISYELVKTSPQI